mmetsp:Transcript_22970/g.35452  ORF Transcript_22970/g.35452 Transcript_22970/m.35452 type:complete len:124 (+) Transcript_22970:1691-2062(+)
MSKDAKDLAEMRLQTIITESFDELSLNKLVDKQKVVIAITGEKKDTFGDFLPRLFCHGVHISNMDKAARLESLAAAINCSVTDEEDETLNTLQKFFQGKTLREVFNIVQKSLVAPSKKPVQTV